MAETLRIRDVTLGILPLNSALFAQDDSDSGKLFVGEPQLWGGPGPHRHRAAAVALVHHPFSYLSEIEQRLIQSLQQNCHFLLRGHLHDNEAEWLASALSTCSRRRRRHLQSRVGLRNRALFVEVELDPSGPHLPRPPYPIRYEDTGHDRWTLDTAVFPRIPQLPRNPHPRARRAGACRRRLSEIGALHRRERWQRRAQCAPTPPAVHASLTVCANAAGEVEILSIAA